MGRLVLTAVTLALASGCFKTPQTSIPDSGLTGAAGAGGNGGAGGQAGTGAAGSAATGNGGAGGTATCASPCAVTAFCANGTCNSRFTEYPIGTTSALGYITSGADGNLWFTTGTEGIRPVGGSIGRLTPAGTPTLFPILSTAQNPYNFMVSSVGIARGPDGNIWFDAVASDGKAYISSITPSGVVAKYEFLMTAPQLGRVAVGPDGNIWAAVTLLGTSSESNTIEVSTVLGSISEQILPTYSNPYDIVAGPDGNVWLTERSNPIRLARLTLAGTLTEFPISGGPLNVTVGADNNIWFTEGANKIGRCTPNGTVVEFDLPTDSASPWDLTKGPDGNVWFTERVANAIGSITPGGKITEYPAPASPYGITTGPDGAIWFTEPSAGKVVRFLVP
jgi:virginiamycin B lyase